MPEAPGQTTPTSASVPDGSAQPLWVPSAERRERALITRFERWLQQERGLHFDGYEALWHWSVDESEAFWSAIVTFFDLPLRVPPSRMCDGQAMPNTQWLPGARLNLVDQIFRHAGSTAPAIVYDSEAAGCGSVGWAELRAQVAALAHQLRDLGVGPGDRVVAFLPNIPQAVVGFLAAASVGAIWSMCSPDMGPTSVLDRFRQIEPQVLLAVDSYRFGGRLHDRREVLANLVAGLPSLRALIWVPHGDPAAPPPPATDTCAVIPWAQALTGPVDTAPAALPASHPLWILYSSGTTGLPKAIVHGHGGVLINGMVNMVLHNDLHPGDRVLWAVNTSWMVWNAHVLSLLGGATLVLYDGAVTGSCPTHDWSHLWQLAGRLGVNVLGLGAAIHQACMKAGVIPREVADLSALRTVCSTGSPLSPEAYRWIYGAVGPDVWLNTVSGGTDIAGGFLVGLPTLPVYLGEMQCRTLGTRVEAWTDEGRPVLDAVGELVCTQALPSMPLYFWADEDQSRYRESYFDSFTDTQGRPVWRHGDWLRLVPRPQAVGGVIYGRSDATINRQGVRMGTAEIYRVVEGLSEVLDSMVVDLEFFGRDSRMILFLQLRVPGTLNESLDRRLRQTIRNQLSARHVPDEIVEVRGIPKTMSGKKLELPIRKLLLGQPLERVVKPDTLAQPELLDAFVSFAARRAEF